MRVVPSSQHNEDDYSQKFWVFGPSFVQTPAETSADEEDDEEAEDPPPPHPPPPPPPPPPLPPKPQYSVGRKKRPRDACKNRRKRTEMKRDKKRKKSEEKGKSEGSTSAPAPPAPPPRAARGSVSSSERWTMERYERAELKVIEVMREKEAEFGHRIARRDLREGARKHIGDTGLLDHLLKHMAGKVVGDRRERFMRGYSNDGVMQYWLEPAELEESRKKGEALDACRCGVECKEEIGLLTEKIGTLNRDLEELRSLKELEKNVWKENYEKLLKRNIKLETEMEEMNSSFQGLKENYERLLKRNVKLESEMKGMNSSFQGLKDEMLLLREEKSKEEDEVKKAVPEVVDFIYQINGEMLFLREEKSKVEDEVKKPVPQVEMIEDAKGGSDNGVGDIKIGNGVCDNGISDKKSENKQEHNLSTSPKGSFCTPQLRKTYLKLPCRGRVCVNCLNGFQKSIDHLSQLSPPLESDQLPSLTYPQRTMQRH